MASTVARHEILPGDHYERIRPRYLRDIVALKQRRRVGLGPDITVVFECRDTVLFQIHEVLRWMARPGDAQIAREIAEYSPLVPSRTRLCATVLIESGSCTSGQQIGRRLSAGADVLWLDIDDFAIAAAALTPEHDPCCPVHYVGFALPAPMLERLADPEARTRLRLQCDAVEMVATLSGTLRTELTALAGAVGAAPSLLSTLARATPRAGAPNDRLHDGPQPQL